LAEFASYSPRRLYPVALISLEDVEEGVRELQRVAARGLKGAMIWSSPPADKPYYNPEYDRFWRCAEEVAMPLTLNVMTPVPEIQKPLLSLVFYGVLERFPGLRFVVAENDSG